MNQLKPFFKKNHWLIIPALLATGSIWLGIWLAYLPAEVSLPSFAAPFFIIGLCYMFLVGFGVHYILALFIVGTATFCSWILIYLFFRWVYRIFVSKPVK